MHTLGLLQIDCVNVVCPAHYMAPFSRLGPYDRTAFDKPIYRSGEFAEHWAHEISIIPAETWPLLRYRRETDRVRPWGFAKVLEERAGYAAWVLEEVRRRGPLAAADLPPPAGAAGRIPGAWIGSVTRGVLEAHFLRGTLAAALVSPFDPLIWCRPRVERLFGFRYRVEILVPPEKRQYGFYVLPFLLGEKLIARVDLKADRASGGLRVLGKWFEGPKTAAVADPLSAELRVLEDWLV